VSETLHFEPAMDRLDLLALPVAAAIREWSGATPVTELWATEIDPEAADTAGFCERYGIVLAESANCVIVEARRGGMTRLAACMILATTRADINGLARRHLGAKRASFAAMDKAVAETAMEYGGITPIGLPADWPVLVDAAAAKAPRVIIGSGLRRSKLSVPGSALANLANAEVLDDLGRSLA